MRNELPSKPLFKECGIVNLDNSDGIGTHWVAYKKNNKQVMYYDPFGDLRPPIEIAKYFKTCDIFYNFEREQAYNTYICGHLCLKFLYKGNDGLSI